jgi:hypothetical protein
MLYSFNARLYDPETARFLQVDPANQFYNPYSYVGGMPNMATDPNGMWSSGSIGALVGGIILTAAVALTIFTAGAAAPVLIGTGIIAGALIGGGISSAVYAGTHQDTFDVKDWGTQTGLGAGFGAVGGGFGTGIGAAGWSAARTIAADVAFNTTIGGVDGYVTNGAINRNHEIDFNEGAGAAAGWGALGGGVSSGVLSILGRGVAISNSRILREGGDIPVGVGLVNKNHFFSHSTIRINETDAVFHQVTTEGKVIKATIGMRQSRTSLESWEDFNPVRAREVSVRVTMNNRVAPGRVALGLEVINAKRRREDLGPYSLCTNSCTTNVVDILQGIGFKVPIYARTAFALHFWFKRLSANQQRRGFIPVPQHID